MKDELELMPIDPYRSAILGLILVVCNILSCIHSLGSLNIENDYRSTAVTVHARMSISILHQAVLLIRTCAYINNGLLSLACECNCTPYFLDRHGLLDSLKIGHCLGSRREFSELHSAVL